MLRSQNQSYLKSPFVDRDDELVYNNAVVLASATGEDNHEEIRRFAARNN